MGVSEEPLYRSPVLRIVDEHGHVEVSWPDPPRPFYEVAHEVIAEIVNWRNEYADIVQRGGDRARMGCPQCIDATGTSVARESLPHLRCIACGTGFWTEDDQ